MSKLMVKSGTKHVRKGRTHQGIANHCIMRVEAIGLKNTVMVGRRKENRTTKVYFKRLWPSRRTKFGHLFRDIGGAIK